MARTKQTARPRKKKNIERFDNRCREQYAQLGNKSSMYFKDVADNRRIFEKVVEILSKVNFKQVEVLCPVCKRCDKKFKTINNLMDHIEGARRYQNTIQWKQHEYVQFIILKFVSEGETLECIADLDFRNKSTLLKPGPDAASNSKQIVDVEANEKGEDAVTVGQKRKRKDDEEEDQHSQDTKVQKAQFECFGRFEDQKQVVWPPVILIQGIVISRKNLEDGSGRWKAKNIQCTDLNKFIMEDLQIPAECVATEAKFLRSTQKNASLLPHPEAKVLQMNCKMKREYSLGTAYFKLKDIAMTQTILLELYRLSEQKRRGQIPWLAYLKEKWNTLSCDSSLRWQDVPSDALYMYQATLEDIKQQFPQPLHFQTANQGTLRQKVSTKLEYQQSCLSKQRRVGVIHEPFFSPSNGFYLEGTQEDCEGDTETLPDTLVLSQNSENNNFEDHAESPCVTEERFQDAQVMDEVNYVEQQEHTTIFEEDTQEQQTLNYVTKAMDASHCLKSCAASNKPSEIICTQKFLDLLHNPDAMQTQNESHNLNPSNASDEHNEIICTQKFLDLLQNPGEQYDQSQTQNHDDNEYETIYDIPMTQRVEVVQHEEDEIMQDIPMTQKIEVAKHEEDEIMQDIPMTERVEFQPEIYDGKDIATQIDNVQHNKIICSQKYKDLQRNPDEKYNLSQTQNQCTNSGHDNNVHEDKILQDVPMTQGVEAEPKFNAGNKILTRIENAIDAPKNQMVVNPKGDTNSDFEMEMECGDFMLQDSNDEFKVRIERRDSLPATQPLQDEFCTKIVDTKIYVQNVGNKQLLKQENVFAQQKQTVPCKDQNIKDNVGEIYGGKVVQNDDNISQGSDNQNDDKIKSGKEILNNDQGNTVTSENINQNEVGSSKNQVIDSQMSNFNEIDVNQNNTSKFDDDCKVEQKAKAWDTDTNFEKYAKTQLIPGLYANLENDDETKVEKSLKSANDNLGQLTQTLLIPGLDVIFEKGDENNVENLQKPEFSATKVGNGKNCDGEIENSKKLSATLSTVGMCQTHVQNLKPMDVTQHTSAGDVSGVNDTDLDTQLKLQQAMEDLELDFAKFIQERKKQLQEKKVELQHKIAQVKTTLRQIENAVRDKYSCGMDVNQADVLQLISAMECCKRSFTEQVATNADENKLL